MRCALIYNPTSGRNPSPRREQIERVAAALTALGHPVEIHPTTAPGSATHLAREAVLRGADAVFACGGDGTIHEVLQALVSETAATAALGIIPLGSANALARHLQLPLNPVQAAIAQIQGEPRTIPVGKLTLGNHARYFSVMAGAGPDGALARHVRGAHKSRLGRLAYYLHAARLFLTRSFPAFQLEFRDAITNKIHSQLAVSIMAVRVRSLGGLFAKLAPPQASIHDETLRLVILSPPASLSLPLWFLSGWLDLHHLNPFLTIIEAASFTCTPLGPHAAHIQADGEYLGQLPLHASILPNALRILTHGLAPQSADLKP